MFIRDLEGNDYFLDGVVKHEQELNGDERIDMDISYTERNAEFLSKKQDLSMWIIIFENKEYRIISCNQTGYGVKYKISVTGILYILDWLNTHRVEERIDASLTVKEAFDLVFNDTPFTYVIVNSAYSERFEGLGESETKLEMFKTFIERYEYEFKIVDKVVYLYSKIGNDTNFEYRYKVNADNITKEVDASEMWTYVRGYADYREDSTPEEETEASVELADDTSGDIDPTKEAKLRPDTMVGNPYISPLAKIIGVREGPSVRNANIKDPELLKKKMKQVVDESVKISFSADIHDMSQVGYDYQHAVIGDRVFLVDERIGLNQEIRVIKIDREVNHLGVLLKIEITFGTSNLSDTYSSNINTAVKDIQDLKEGKIPLPFPALDIRAQSMVKVLENTNSELTFDSNGVHAVDKTNKNNLVTLNSSGLMLSTDGGRTAKTALTAEGIVADAITTGTMLADRIQGGILASNSGSMEWDLNNNRFDYKADAITNYYGNSKIEFHTGANSLFLTLNGTTSFLNFMTAMDSKHSAVVLGTSENGISAGGSDFVGIKAQTAKATPLGISQAELFGERIIFDGDGGERSTGSWMLETNDTKQKTKVRRFFGVNTDEGYKYELGTISNRFNTVWTKTINDNIRIVNYPNDIGVILSPNLKNGVKFSNDGLELIYNGANYDVGKLIEKINS